MNQEIFDRSELKTGMQMIRKVQQRRRNLEKSLKPSDLKKNPKTLNSMNLS